DQGHFVKARNEWIEPILDVEIGETMGLLSALKRIDELQFYDTYVEIDCKRVVDDLYSKRILNSDFGATLSDLRVLLSTNLVKSNVKFIRR
ncbi:cytochrome P450, partial [Trifolium medium]|nr:cytochrome P450 [Trifolium medium]